MLRGPQIKRQLQTIKLIFEKLLFLFCYKRDERSWGSSELWERTFFIYLFWKVLREAEATATFVLQTVFEFKQNYTTMKTFKWTDMSGYISYI